MNVSFCDLKKVYEAQRDELDEAFRRVMANGFYIRGQETKAFEKEFSEWLGAAGCSGVANGTDAVEIALRALGISPGDNVATVSHTAVATVAAIERLGAHPVLADIDEATYCMDPASLERILKQRKIHAVVPVHIYGQCANMEAIMELAHSFGARVVEDCAQAHGASRRGRMAGTFGDAAAFSFYPTKNLGAFGDGGAVVAGDKAITERAAQIGQYGWKKRYISEFPGCNSRLDEVQAALLRVRLKRLAPDNEHRRKSANLYLERLSSMPGIILPTVDEGNIPVWHLFVIRVQHGLRDKVAQRMASSGIPTAIHYPLPAHLQPAYRERIATDPAGLPATEKIHTEILSLPMHAHLAKTEIDMVCDALEDALGKASA